MIREYGWHFPGGWVGVLYYLWDASTQQRIVSYTIWLSNASLDIRVCEKNLFNNDLTHN